MSPNARWYIADNEIYHIITRGNNKMKVFHSKSDFIIYVKLITKYKALYPLFLYHYCLMPNHIHLLLKTSKGKDLKKFMQGVNQSYSNYYKRTYNHTGHLWQGRFKSFLIQKESYLLDCGRYIERNPLRAGLVQDPLEWPWSSYAFYSTGEANPLIEEHGLYLQLGRTPTERQVNYREYVLNERPYESLLDQHFQTT